MQTDGDSESLMSLEDSIQNRMSIFEEYMAKQEQQIRTMIELLSEEKLANTVKQKEMQATIDAQQATIEKLNTANAKLESAVGQLQTQRNEDIASIQAESRKQLANEIERQEAIQATQEASLTQDRAILLYNAFRISDIEIFKDLTSRYGAKICLVPLEALKSENLLQHAIYNGFQFITSRIHRQMISIMIRLAKNQEQLNAFTTKLTVNTGDDITDTSILGIIARYSIVSDTKLTEIAEDNNADAAILSIITNHAKISTAGLTAVARNNNTDVDTLLVIAKNKSTNAAGLTAIAGHANANTSVLNFVANHPNIDTAGLTAVAMNNTTSADTLSVVAKHESTNAAGLIAVAKHDNANTSVLSLVAQNSNADATVFGIIAHHSKPIFTPLRNSAEERDKIAKALIKASHLIRGRSRHLFEQAGSEVLREVQRIESGAFARAGLF